MKTPCCGAKRGVSILDWALRRHGHRRGAVVRVVPVGPYQCPWSLCDSPALLPALLRRRRPAGPAGRSQGRRQRGNSAEDTCMSSQAARTPARQGDAAPAPMLDPEYLPQHKTKVQLGFFPGLRQDVLHSPWKRNIDPLFKLKVRLVRQPRDSSSSPLRWPGVK